MDKNVTKKKKIFEMSLPIQQEKHPTFIINIPEFLRFPQDIAADEFVVIEIEIAQSDGRGTVESFCDLQVEAERECAGLGARCVDEGACGVVGG